ncbi:MAG: cyclic nucleotide-binding domain-containing protein [Thermoanaerobaculia bacterium]
MEPLTCIIRNALSEPSDQTLATLDSLKKTHVYQPGDRLFTEGEQPRAVYVVCSGSVRLFLSSGQGRMLDLRTTEAGEILGLTSVLADRPYDMTAEVVEPSKIGIIDREEILSFFSSQNDVGIRILEILSKDVHNCYELVRSFSEKGHRHRM